MQSRILAVRRVSTEPVYDIGVENNHNLFVRHEGKPALVHNCHSSAAMRYSEVLNSLNMRIRIGATGTVERKDCVVADTPVLTEHGACAIQDIRVGDRVYSKSAAGDLELREVVEIHVRQNSPTVKVAYDGGIIQCTPDHEFWTTRGYVKAKDLTPEDELIEFSPDLE